VDRHVVRAAGDADHVERVDAGARLADFDLPPFGVAGARAVAGARDLLIVALALRLAPEAAAARVGHEQFGDRLGGGGSDPAIHAQGEYELSRRSARSNAGRAAAV